MAEDRAVVEIVTLAAFQRIADAYEKEGKKVLWGNLTRGLICFECRGKRRTAWV